MILQGIPYYENFLPGVQQPDYQTDDGVGASSLDQSESDPTAATGYGGGVY